MTTSVVAAWQDPSRPDDERVEALLAEMTLTEKIAQLGSVWWGFEAAAGDVAPTMNAYEAVDDFGAAVQHGIGHLTRPFGTRPVTPADGWEGLRSMQEQVTASRLGIPAIAHEECLTGFTTLGATVFPASIAWAATFDPALVREMAAAIGSDMRSVGVHQGLSPVLDVVRDPRWGRVEETLGEDPHLVSQLAGAYVRGLQESGVIATLKHFAGYSASRGARNHAPVSMGPRELAEHILPPFEYAVRLARAGSVMNSYSDVDGVPAAADHHLLTQTLRDDWGFEGTVVSDYWAIPFLRSVHHLTDTWGGAGVAALTAGIDVELPAAVGYGATLEGEVAAGRVDESFVDRAARRVLTQKLRLGLLEPGWTMPPLPGSVDLDPPRNRDIARRLADRSVVLLSNPKAVLPLRQPRRLAVVGPCADDPQAFFGCYAFPNHVLPHFPDVEGIGIEAPSLLDALRAEFPDAEIVHHLGCDVTGGDLSGVAAAAAAAAAADVTLLVVGDRAGLFGLGTSGEGCDAADLALPGHQGALVESVLSAGAGVVVVLVSVSGRPYALGSYEDRTAAIVQSFFPGEEGGQAIAGVLSGRINPSGRLPVEVARDPGGQPHTYLAPLLGQNSHGVSNLDPTPAFPFGHGLSYTELVYSPLTGPAGPVATDATIDLAVTVTNTGVRDAEDVVQLYAADPVASVTRPVTQLVGFRRVVVAAGESVEVTFAVHTDRLSFVGPQLTRIVEPGEVVFSVGTAGHDASGPFPVVLQGDVRTVSARRVMDTPTTDRRDGSR